MENFKYSTPTRLIFGEGVISGLKEVILEKGHKVLLTYGGGSIKKIGLYDKIKKELEGLEIYELSGIQPNPKYNPSVLDGVKICKEKGIEVVLAVGGGSVLDCSKAICAGACYDGEPWDLITYKAPITKALPLVTVLTLAATGSEYDSGGVISRTETNDKVGFGSKYTFPYASFLDPTNTFSVSKMQTAAGTADAINHVMEEFFCEKASTLTDGMCEAVIKSLIKNCYILLSNPYDYDARGEMMACCSLACNGILSIGNSHSGWPMHAIEHALSGYYDITHGVGLAIIAPRWMNYINNDQTRGRIVEFGKRIFDINEKDPLKASELTIKKTYELFESFGIPMHLREVGIDDKRINEMAHHIAVNEESDKFWAPLTEEDIVNILKDSL